MPRCLVAQSRQKIMAPLSPAQFAVRARFAVWFPIDIWRPWRRLDAGDFFQCPEYLFFQLLRQADPFDASLPGKADFAREVLGTQLTEVPEVVTELEASCLEELGGVLHFDHSVPLLHDVDADKFVDQYVTAALVSVGRLVQKLAQGDSVRGVFERDVVREQPQPPEACGPVVDLDARDPKSLSFFRGDRWRGRSVVGCGSVRCFFGTGRATRDLRPTARLLCVCTICERLCVFGNVASGHRKTFTP